MGKVFSCQGYDVSVRSRERATGHNKSHCHIQRGDSEASVALFTWEVLAGHSAFPNSILPRKLRQALEENIDKLADEWDRLNPTEN